MAFMLNTSSALGSNSKEEFTTIKQLVLAKKYLTAAKYISSKKKISRQSQTLTSVHAYIDRILCSDY